MHKRLAVAVVIIASFLAGFVAAPAAAEVPDFSGSPGVVQRPVTSAPTERPAGSAPAWCRVGPDGGTSNTCPVVVWGGVTFWFYDMAGNWSGWYIGAYDAGGHMIGDTYVSTPNRYLWDITVDVANQQVVTHGQSSLTGAVPWSTLAGLALTPTVSLSASPNPADLVDEVTLLAQVTSIVADPGGVVEFRVDGSDVLGSDTVSSAGEAELTVDSAELGVGTHAITARYLPPPGSDLIASTSSAVNLVVLAVTHTVTFVDWDGATLDEQSVEDGADAVAPAAPSRPGHTFTGWDTDFLEVTGDLTVTASYQANTYVVAFDAAGGSVDPGSQVKLFGAVYGVGADGETAEPLPVPTRTGHTFVGWFTEPSGGGGQMAGETEVATAQDHTLYASWAIDTYTVTFLDWDGTVLAEHTVEHGDAVPAPEVPGRTGYSLIGWDQGFSEVTSNMTIRPFYTANTYTVAFDAGEGDVDPASQVKLFGAVYGVGADGGTAEPLPVPTRTGYSFVGWSTEPNGGGEQVTDDTLVATAEHHTLYAHWEADAYTVAFDAAGGSVDPGSQVKLFGAVYGVGADGGTAETLPVPTRTGYSFVGWFTEPNGGGEQVTDDTLVATAEHHTLYALWEEILVVSALELSASSTTVDQGGSVTVTVLALDQHGGALHDVSDQVEITSDVPTDRVEGNVVTFPTASPHTLTVTHVPTGVTAELVVEVVAADEQEEGAAGTGDSAAEEIAQTGVPGVVWLLAMLTTLGAGTVLLLARGRLLQGL